MKPDLPMGWVRHNHGTIQVPARRPCVSCGEPTSEKYLTKPSVVIYQHIRCVIQEEDRRYWNPNIGETEQGKVSRISRIQDLG